MIIKQYLLFSHLIITTIGTVVANAFQPGYFYNSDGKKVLGLIKIIRANSSVLGDKPTKIKFKADEKSKPVTLTANDIPSFVVEQDSFTVAHNFIVTSTGGEYKKDFVKVIETGKVNLYLHLSAGNDGRYNYILDKFVISSNNSTFIGIWNIKH